MRSHQQHYSFDKKEIKMKKIEEKESGKRKDEKESIIIEGSTNNHTYDEQEKDKIKIQPQIQSTPKERCKHRTYGFISHPIQSCWQANCCNSYYHTGSKLVIVYNTCKTECMIVSSARSRVYYLELPHHSGRALAFVDRFIYLGHVLHRDMTDDIDIKKQTTFTGNTLLWKFPNVAWRWSWNYSGITATLCTAIRRCCCSRRLLGTVKKSMSQGRP